MSTNNPLNKEIAGNHYKQYKMQPIELIAAMHWDFFQGNIFKYCLRAKYKNGKQDIDKAVHYCELALELKDELDNWRTVYEHNMARFIDENGLDPNFFEQFLLNIDREYYDRLKEMLSDNQIVKKYFL